jgi:protein-ribulosamine 3-kinase
MNTEIPKEIAEHLSAQLNFGIKDFSYVGGGCINPGGRLRTTQGDFFLKWNSATKFSKMFEAEARGLTLLRKPSVIHIPEVIATASLSQWQFLLLELIEGKKKSPRYWQNLGQQLALLHKNSSPSFGLDHDNYIGSLPQLNQRKNKWVDFFIEQRLRVQVELALKNSEINPQLAVQFELLFKKLPQLLPEENPSLLHGDLWSGNLITDSTGEPCLIDPAVYYGNREAEIAFTLLFGGFSTTFYESYNENYPLLPGSSTRSDIYNLYPLMVHVNLFGGGYLSQVISILNRFV